MNHEKYLILIRIAPTSVACPVSRTRRHSCLERRRRGQLWTNAANWHGLAPVVGDDIVFPGTAPADSLINTNNFPPGTLFGSLTISGTNYNLSGNSIILTNGISHASGGTNSLALFLQLNASQRFEATVASGELDASGNINLNGNNLTNDITGRINLEGEISGTGNLVKNGAGTLFLFGDSPNTYVGSMTVNDGILELGKSDHTILGNLQIGDGVGAVDSAVVFMFADNQINDSSAVTIEDDGLLDLNNSQDARRQRHGRPRDHEWQRHDFAREQSRPAHYQQLHVHCVVQLQGGAQRHDARLRL